MEQRNNVNLSLFIQLARVNNHQMNKKRSQEYQSMDLEYVTGQINPVIREWSWKKTLTEKNKKMHNDYIPNILQMTAIDILVIYKCRCRIEGLL